MVRIYLLILIHNCEENDDVFNRHVERTNEFYDDDHHNDYDDYNDDD